MDWICISDVLSKVELGHAGQPWQHVLFLVMAWTHLAIVQSLVISEVSAHLEGEELSSMNVAFCVRM